MRYGSSTFSKRKLACVLGLGFMIAFALLVMVTPGSIVSSQPSPAREQSLYDVQRGINSGLEAEIAAFRNALNGDVCVAKGTLSTSPQIRTLPPPQKKGEQNSSAKTVGELMEQATVLVVASGSKKVSAGTGFFIAPGKVLTNRHVVGEQPGKVFVVNKALGGIKEGTVSVISKEEDRDYAVITLDVDSSTQLPFLALKPSVKRMDRVSAWGYPGMVTSDDPKFQALMTGDLTAVPEVVYTEGVVSVVLDHAAPVIVHTALISHGSSGGPLVDENGAVVGINTYINLDSKSYRQSSMSLAGKDLIAFLETNGVPVKVAGEIP